ncbi:MAG: DUF2493 domain-containing protein [Rhodospirillaceae bacterium]|nr:DUF2493 domain-containing protein [Rhodospirillaceae bacterium]
MAVRYVIRTVDEDWIDLVDEPARIDDRSAAWAEAKRRIAADPDLKTVVFNRDTGAILWQSDPAIPPRYRVATADRTVVYAIDDADFPIEVLSDHKEKDDAWTAFYDAVAAYRDATGSTWRPRRGSHVSQTGTLTSAAIDARDYMRAKKDRKTMAHLPQGTLVAIAGGKDVTDPGAVFDRLDKVRAKYADMVLVHGGGPGVERIAAQWAEKNGVHQVVCKPDWDRHGRAAPFRRNDELLNLLPKGVIAFPGSGITENLVDKARQLGIPVVRCAA